MTTGKKLLNLLLAPVVIAAAVLLVVVLVKSRKVPPPRTPAVAVPRVEIIASSPSDAVPVISTYGNIRTYHRTEVAGQVGGKVELVSPNFDPGRAVKQGFLLVKIEDADFKTAVAERESALAAARQTLADEETRSRIAREDWTTSGRRIEDAPDFTLRKPQLAAARASVEAAEAALEQSLLDLQRTEIRASFDAIVQSRAVSPGNVVAAGASLGALIDRNKAEVRLPLTAEQAARLDLPLAFVPGANPSLRATLRDPSRPNLQWDALVTRTEPAVDERNQVLYIIAEVSRPFENGDAFLPVGAFVIAELPGKKLENVHRIPDAALIDDAYVWAIDAGENLRRQPVARLFSEKGSFLARIESPVVPPPLRVVTRPLASFREGTPVAIAADPE